jgi:hypothetical protein
MIVRPPVWVVNRAARFWADAGDPPPFPRDLTKAIAWLPHLHVAARPHITLTTAADHFARCGVPFRITEPDRALRGCFGAHAGQGFILIDAADDEAEQRLSLTHELAHFLNDYEEPRRRAVERLGPGVLEVLDGKRKPTTDERLAGVLRNVPVGSHTHLLGRDKWGRPATDTEFEAEAAADRLAFELLAPFDAVMASPATDRQSLAKRLVSNFGLPSIPAAKYAAALLSKHFPQKFWPAFVEN